MRMSYNVSDGIANPAFSTEETDGDKSKCSKSSLELKASSNSAVNGASVRVPNNAPLDEGKYGWLWLHPKFLQRFLTAKWVLFWLCWAAAIQGMVINGFINVVISTIEKRFHLKSANTGLISGTYDIGVVLCSIPVSYLGSLPGASKPRWLGWGMFIMGLGSFTFALPHFFSPPYEIGGSSTTAVGQDVTKEALLCLSKSANDSSEKCHDTADIFLSNFQYLFILGQILHGVGASPLYILGTTFLDECVPLKMSSFYIGIFHTMAVLGPAVGYVVGGQLLSLYIEAPQVDPTILNITQDSELWLGAWWVGFLISGSMALLLSWVLMAFPPEISGAQERALERSGAVDHMDSKAFAHIRHLPRAVKALFTNITFVSLSLAEASEGALVSGVASFMPKVIENQFGFSAGLAALLVGVVTVPAGGTGTFLGGYVIKRFKMGCKAILNLCFVVSLAVMICSVGFIKPCKESLFAGVNVFYDDRNSVPDTPSLLSVCNIDCSCVDNNSFDPICGVNNVMYFSPCHAGCLSSEELPNGQDLFTKCKCLDLLPPKNGSLERLSLKFRDRGEEEVNLPSLSAARTSCSRECSVQYWFLALFCVMIFLTFLLTTPSLSGTLRCVHDTHRSLALGLQGIQMRIFGTIPGPIMFGALVMDQSCYLWQTNCDGAVGSCRHYDNSKMTLNFVLLAFLLKLISTVLYFISWWTYKHVERPKSDSLSRQ